MLCPPEPSRYSDVPHAGTSAACSLQAGQPALGLQTPGLLLLPLTQHGRPQTNPRQQDGPGHRESLEGQAAMTLLLGFLSPSLLLPKMMFKHTATFCLHSGNQV